MICDDDKEHLKILIELHKENADLMKTVLSLLAALLTVFGLAAVAVLSTGTQGANIIAKDVDRTNQAIPSIVANGLSSDKVAYMIFGVLLLQNFFLRETMLRSGYQKCIEELINDICGRPLAFLNLGGGISVASACNMGFHAFTVMILINALEKGLFPEFISWCRSDSPLPSELISTQAILLLLLIFSYVEVFSSRSRGYRQSIDIMRKLYAAQSAAIDQASSTGTSKITTNVGT